ncbi:(d)CMP kinase [Bradyrhizobium diazoefficiens]|nr:(d)CMP kinase [Bradyrhizobium diazoefficiens]
MPYEQREFQYSIGGSPRLTWIQYRSIRKSLVHTAKQFVRHQSFVADGRTVSQIFLDADIHFFVSAEKSVARSRRVAEGQDAALFDQRWSLDEHRLRAPLNSIAIDTTSKEPDEILSELLRCVSQCAT